MALIATVSKPSTTACTALAWPRCRPLAISIVALARPVIVIVVKKIVARDRPPASLAIVHPGGYSFPSGHPFTVAASWGFIPLVVALYTKRRWIWWAAVVVVWSMVVVIAGSRVYLGAHWTTDVVGTLSLAVVFVAGSEVLIDWLHHHDVPAVFSAVMTSGRRARISRPGRTDGAFTTSGRSWFREHVAEV